MGCCCCSSVSNVVVPGPPDRYPGTGEQVNHHFVNALVKLHYKQHFMSRKMRQSSDLDSYYPLLSEQYERGYRLLEFLPLPGQARVGGMRTIKQEFQGIFYWDTSEERDEQWRLQVEQSTLSFKSSFSGVLAMKSQTTGDMSNMFSTISELTAKGAKYLGMAQTGMETEAHGVFRPTFDGLVIVDLYFEVPSAVTKQTYIYQTLVQDVNAKIRAKFGGAGVECDCDWQGTMDIYLAQGWKLITAFADMTSAQTQTRMMGADMQLRCLWIFEKPASKAKDNTRLYEGKIIEFSYKIKRECCGTKSVTLWNATIDDMGQRGWYLAAILPTPEMEVSGYTITTKVLLCFQRKCGY